MAPPRRPRTLRHDSAPPTAKRGRVGRFRASCGRRQQRRDHRGHAERMDDWTDLDLAYLLIFDEHPDLMRDE